MYDFFRWVLGKEYIYAYSASFSKHGGKYYPKGPKSNSHNGINVSNQFIQGTIKSTYPLGLNEIANRSLEELLKIHPNSSNYKIEWIRRLD